MSKERDCKVLNGTITKIIRFEIWFWKSCWNISHRMATENWFILAAL